MGIATQSHWIAVGTIVPWIRADSGAVITQAWGEMSYGPKGLLAMRNAKSPSAALEELLEHDEHSEARQVAFMDRSGDVAVHTGARCIANAGHSVGPGVVCAANMMRQPGVPEAMVDTWTRTAGSPLSQRLLETLQTAQDLGGDLRGQQSAALRVVGHERENWWDATYIDLRVDDHPDALAELRRLVPTRLAYYEGREAERLELIGDPLAATRSYERAAALLPGSSELTFWRGVMRANNGDIAGARQALAVSFAEHDGWRELLRRLPASGLLQVSEEVLAELLD